MPHRLCTGLVGTSVNIGIMVTDLAYSFLVVLITVMSFALKYGPTKRRILDTLERLWQRQHPVVRCAVSSKGFKIRPKDNDFRKTADLRHIGEALSQLLEYRVRAQSYNDIVFDRATRVSTEHLNELKQLGYFTKIQASNRALEANQATVEQIVEETLQKIVNANDPQDYMEITKICEPLGYSLNGEGRLTKVRNESNIAMQTNTNQGSVTEALCHLGRDYAPYYERERVPLIDYMVTRINEAQEKIGIVVPGAGAGQLAYNLSLRFPQAQVHSIELSPLMYICNEFALDHKEDLQMCMFPTNYSSKVTASDQTRAIDVPLSSVSRPRNLNVHWGDFRDFRIAPEGPMLERIYVCTAYFMDTAENLFEYLETIESLGQFCKELHWVNVGPLKYGTRPLVQLTAEEFTRLREVRGWRDRDCGIEQQNLNGYLTDYESLYQGFYGLVRFHTVFKRRPSVP